LADVSEEQALAGELACLAAWESDADFFALSAVNLALFDIL
jgi:hypothetical protein